MLRPLAFTMVLLPLFTTSVLRASDADRTPGAISGTANVTQHGSASYTIPIDCPAGTNGMQPKLSLQYNSQAGLGVMGQGWSIAGYSQITRGPKNLVVDGEVAGVKFTPDDAVYFDGQCLIPIVKTSDFIEYRTEIDSYVRVRQTLTGPGPVFTAWTQAGRVLQFGSSPNSRPSLASGEAILWLCDRVEDRSGNFFTLTYTHHDNGTDGDYDLARVDYTGNTAAGLNPFASIEFEFKPIDEKAGLTRSFTYIHGRRVTRRFRLVGVVSRFQDRPLMTLRMAYEDEPKKPGDPIPALEPTRVGFRLRQIEKTGRDGKLKFAPTEFAYSDSLGPGQVAWNNLPNLSLPGEIGSDNIKTAGQVGVRYADVNGDGYDDLLASTKPGESLVFLNAKTNWQRIDDASIKLDQPFVVGDRPNEAVVIRDINGDGAADYLYARVGEPRVTKTAEVDPGNHQRVKWVDQPTLALPGDLVADGEKTSHLFTDLNKDGKLDFAWDAGAVLNAGASWTPSNDFKLPLSLTDAFQFVTIDLNGDGIDDLVTLSARNGNLRAWTVNPGAARWDAASLLGGNPVSNLQNIEVLDLDGDGKKELILYRETRPDADPNKPLDQSVIVLGQRAGTLKPRKIVFPGEVVVSGRPIGFQWLDLNGDNLRDIVAFTVVEKPEANRTREPVGAFLQKTPDLGFDFQWDKDEKTDFIPPYPLAVLRASGELVRLPAFFATLTKSKKLDLIYHARGPMAGFTLPMPLTYLNATSAWQFSSTYAPPGEIAFVDPAPELLAAMQMVDLDADGLTDLLQWGRSSDTTEQRVPYAALNTGVGWKPFGNYKPPYPLIDNGKTSGAVFIDVNGDALADMVVHRQGVNGGPRTDNRAYLNTGHGWTLDQENWRSPTPIVHDTRGGLGTRFIDLNADGLTDILSSRRLADGTSHHEAWLNQGNGWSKNYDFAKLPDGFGFVGQKVDPPAAGAPAWEVPVDQWDGYLDGRTDLVLDDVQPILRDLNDDRLPDIAYHFKIRQVTRDRVTLPTGMDVFRLTVSNDSTTVKGALINTGKGWIDSGAAYTPPIVLTDVSSPTPIPSPILGVRPNNDLGWPSPTFPSPEFFG